MIRRSAPEKQEIIDLVEHSTLPVGLAHPRRAGRAVQPPGIGGRGSFYRWYQQYQQEGEKWVEPQPQKRWQFWNRLAEAVCDQIVQLALTQPEKSARRLAWLFADQEG